METVELFFDMSLKDFMMRLFISAILIGLCFHDTRVILANAYKKMATNLTSKRFITLAIATWFVYTGTDINPNWLLLAGFYIGIDYAKHEGILKALAVMISNLTPKSLPLAEEE